MKAKQLRIGNLAQDKLTKEILICCGLSCDTDGKNTKIEFSVANRNNYPLPDGWQAIPIPLTEDWLKGFGFKWKNFAMRLGEFCIRKQINGWMLYIRNENYDKLIHLEYVHVLQNNYFYIEQKELILKD